MIFKLIFLIVKIIISLFVLMIVGILILGFMSSDNEDVGNLETYCESNGGEYVFWNECVVGEKVYKIYKLKEGLKLIKNG